MRRTKKSNQSGVNLFYIINLSWVIIDILLCWCFENKYDWAPNVLNLRNEAQVAIPEWWKHSIIINIMIRDYHCQNFLVSLKNEFFFQIDRLGVSMKREFQIKIQFLCPRSDRNGWQYLWFGLGWIGFTR